MLLQVRSGEVPGIHGIEVERDHPQPQYRSVRDGGPGARGRPAAAAVACSRLGPRRRAAVHTGIAVSQLHPQPRGAKLADELPSPSIRDRLLNHVAFEPSGNGLLDSGLRREHGNAVDLVDLVRVETPLTEPEPTIVGPTHPLASGEDDLDLPGVHVSEAPQRERGVASDNPLPASRKNGLVIFVERSHGQRSEAVEALSSPFEAARHGQPAEVVGADTSVLCLLGPDEAVLIGSQLDKAVVGSGGHAWSVAPLARY